MQQQQPLPTDIAGCQPGRRNCIIGKFMTSENYVVGWKIPLCSVLRHKGLEIPIGQSKSRDRLRRFYASQNLLGSLLKLIRN